MGISCSAPRLGLTSRDGDGAEAEEAKEAKETKEAGIIGMRRSEK